MSLFDHGAGRACARACETPAASTTMQMTDRAIVEQTLAVTSTPRRVTCRETELVRALYALPGVERGKIAATCARDARTSCSCGRVPVEVGARAGLESPRSCTFCANAPGT